jgi:hypothetical protein
MQTVVLVHGTWASSQDSRPKWYETRKAEPDSFVSKLDGALSQDGSEARCWAHCQDEKTYSWSGENSWLARSVAAAQLRNYLRRLIESGWRCHVVAHSHGGNVLAEALADLTTREVDALGQIITIGTPFLDTFTPFQRRRAIMRRILLIPAIALYLTIIVLTGISLFVFVYDIPRRGLLNPDPNLTIVRIITAATFLIATTAAIKSLLSAYHRRRATKSASTVISGKTLIYSTQHDEAYLTLRHFERSFNPLDPGVGMITYLRAAYVRYVTRQAEIAKQLGFLPFREAPRSWRLTLTLFYFLFIFFIFGLWLIMGIPGYDRSIGMILRPIENVLTIITSSRPSDTFVAIFSWAFSSTIPLLVSLLVSAAFVFGMPFFALLIAPLRYPLRLIASLRILPKEMITYSVRKRVWDVFKDILFGLDAYRFQPPKVLLAPDSGPLAGSRFEELPLTIIQALEERRGLGIVRQIPKVTELFSATRSDMTDVITLLKEIEDDVTLLHAAYYTEDVCIHRIAKWIATS